MIVERFDGWFEGIAHLPSSHFNQRPDNTEISLLVIHNISLPPGQFGTPHIAELFQGCLNPNTHPYFAEIAHLEVSAHFVIDRQGLATQFVSVFDRAWHAGASMFNNVGNCNDYSVGIELEGSDDIPYTDAQYKTLAEITGRLQLLFPLITSERIVGHEVIAPFRKTDPGPAFEWARYLTDIKTKP